MFEAWRGFAASSCSPAVQTLINRTTVGNAEELIKGLEARAIDELAYGGPCQKKVGQKDRGSVAVAEAIVEVARVTRRSHTSVRNRYYRLRSDAALEAYAASLPLDVARLFTGRERGLALLKLLKNGYLPAPIPNLRNHKQAIFAAWTAEFKGESRSVKLNRGWDTVVNP